MARSRWRAGLVACGRGRGGAILSEYRPAGMVAAVAVPPVAIQGVYQISFRYGLRTGGGGMGEASGGGGDGGLQAVPFVAAAVPLAGAGAAVSFRGLLWGYGIGLAEFFFLRWLVGTELAVWIHVGTFGLGVVLMWCRYWVR